MLFLCFKKMKFHNLKNNIKRIYYAKDLFLLKRKFNCLKNKNILLIGSGPNVTLDIKHIQNLSIVCCNGSGSYLKNKNLKINPLLTIVDNELIDSSNLGNLISVQSNKSKNSDPSLLEASYDSFNYINKNLRRLIINKVVNTNFIEINDQSLLSTGIFAISLCFYLGASSVFFTGFSLWKNKKDYFYSIKEKSDKDYLVRNHSLADSLYISLLKVKNYKLFTNDKDFLPLMSNWGGG
jgi:hypothetical protein